MMSVGTRHLVPSFAWEKEQEGGETETRRRKCGESGWRQALGQLSLVQKRALTDASCTLPETLYGLRFHRP